MRYEAELGFVLHARAWRETSLLLEILSREHGRLGVLARGTTGLKKQAMRAALQPLQHVRIDAVQHGELAQLRTVEAVDIAPILTGNAMLAGFYLNELSMRLAPRQDPQPELYAAYARTRERLRACEPLAWTLRRFERDLLQALGFGFADRLDGDGEPLDPAARYTLDPEYGARRMRDERAGATRLHAATGRALLDLAMDHMPQEADLASLRRAIRPLLAYHLGGRGLKSWELAAWREQGLASPTK